MNLLTYIKQHCGIILVVVLTFATVGFFLLTRLNVSAQEVTTYETKPAALGELTAIVGATGTVRVNQSASLAWKTSGTLARVNYQAGEQVKALFFLQTFVHKRRHKRDV